MLIIVIIIHIILVTTDANLYKKNINKAIKNLESVGSTIYRTDKDGTVIVSSDGENINISFKDTNLDG